MPVERWVFSTRARGDFAVPSERSHCPPKAEHRRRVPLCPPESSAGANLEARLPRSRSLSYRFLRHPCAGLAVPRCAPSARGAEVHEPENFWRRSRKLPTVPARHWVLTMTPVMIHSGEYMTSVMIVQTPARPGVYSVLGRDRHRRRSDSAGRADLHGSAGALTDHLCESRTAVDDHADVDGSQRDQPGNAVQLVIACPERCRQTEHRPRSAPASSLTKNQSVWLRPV